MVLEIISVGFSGGRFGDAGRRKMTGHNTSVKRVRHNRRYLFYDIYCTAALVFTSNRRVSVEPPGDTRVLYALGPRDYGALPSDGDS